MAAAFPESASKLELHGTWHGPIEKWVFDSADLKSARSMTRMRLGAQDIEVYFAGPEPT